MPKLIVNPDFFENRDGEYVLVCSKCRKCGKIAFPKKKFCFDCMDETMEAHPVCKTGRIATFSIARQSFTYGMELPYAFGYVDLDDGLRLFGVFTECEPYEKKLRVGGRVELVIGKLKDDDMGNEIIGYLFRPIKE